MSSFCTGCETTLVTLSAQHVRFFSHSGESHKFKQKSLMQIECYIICGNVWVFPRSRFEDV